jgi:hypothetical protein
MARHLVVIDTDTGKVGQIDGPTDKRLVTVVWPDGQYQEIQASKRYPRVIEYSLEYLALLEPEKCKKLFADDRIRFFTELLSLCVGKKSYDGKSIYGSEDSAEGSLRGRLKDSKGELLFTDFAAFKKAWKSIEVAIVSEPNSVSRIMHGNRWYYQIKFYEDVSPLGKASKGDQPTFTEALDEDDTGSVISALKSCKPVNKWQSFVKNLVSQNDSPELTVALIEEIIDGVEQCATRDDLYDTFRRSLSFLLQNAKKSDLPICICIAIGAGEGHLVESASPSKYLDQLESFLFNSMSIPSSIPSDVWCSRMLEHLLSRGHQFRPESDLDKLVDLIVEKPIRESDTLSLLETVHAWLKTESGNQAATQVQKRRAIQRILASFSSSIFDELRLGFLEIGAQSGNAELANSEYFKGLNFKSIFSISSPISAFMERPKIFERVAVPVILEALNRGLTRYEFSLILSASDTILELIRKNDLGVGVNAAYNAIGSGSEYKELAFLKPMALLSEIRDLNQALNEKELENQALGTELNKLNQVKIALERDIARLSRQLVAAQGQSEAALVATLRSEIFEIAKAFSNVSRLVRRQSDVELPQEQVVAEIGIEERNVGIFPKFHKGEVLSYNPEFMTIISGHAEPDDSVTVLDPAYTIQIRKEKFVLTKALVCSNMET